MKHVKFQYPDLKRLITSTAIADGKGVQVVVEEAGQQKGFIDDLSRSPELMGYTIRARKPRGDKFNRAMPWCARAETGNVHVCQGVWNRQFFEECSSFTSDNSHAHDDQIDAVSGGYQSLTDVHEVVGARIAF